MAEGHLALSSQTTNAQQTSQVCHICTRLSSATAFISTSHKTTRVVLCNAALTQNLVQTQPPLALPLSPLSPPCPWGWEGFARTWTHTRVYLPMAFPLLAQIPVLQGCCQDRRCLGAAAGLLSMPMSSCGYRTARRLPTVPGKEKCMAKAVVTKRKPLFTPRRARCWQRTALGNSSLQQSRDSISFLDFNSLSLTLQQFVSHMGKAKGSRDNTYIAYFTSPGAFPLHTQHFLADKMQQFWLTKPPFLAARPFCHYLCLSQCTQGFQAQLTVKLPQGLRSTRSWRS